MSNLARKIEKTPLYDFQAIINENIRVLMVRFGFNQRTLAEALGITPGAISHYLNARREWGLTDLAKVASVFGTTPWDLVTPSRDYEKSQAESLAHVLQLPRLDSNQRPSDIQLNSLSLVDVKPNFEDCHGLAPVVELTEWRAA